MLKPRLKAPRQQRGLQRGEALVQTAITIIVAAIFLMGAVIYGFRYINKGKVANEVTALSDLKASTVTYGQRVGFFTAANTTNAILVSQNFFPSSQVGGTVAAPTVSHQWGGAVTVAIGTVNTAGDSLVFTRAGVPGAACSELAVSLDPVASTISVGGVVTKATGAATVPATVNTQCLAGGDNNTIAVTLAR